MSSQGSLEVPIRDRAVAGQALARLLQAYRQRRDAVVLALPRGGVPVAYEIAMQLELRLDLVLVRKLGVPGHAELALGAIASGGVRVINNNVLRHQAIPPAAIEAVAAREKLELQRREQVYRGQRPAPLLRGQQVILVDDGLATGATMQAAVLAVRQQAPARIVVAVPVAAADSAATLRRRVDELVCPLQVDELISIGQWYRHFEQTSDGEVLQLLHQAWQRDCEQPQAG